MFVGSLIPNAQVCKLSHSRATCHRQSRHNTNTSTCMQTTVIVIKVVLTSTCQATRPFQGCVGVQLVGDLVGVRSDVVQHALGGRQGGVASHHRAQLVDGRRGVVSTRRRRHLQRWGGAAAHRYHVDGRGSAAGGKRIGFSWLISPWTDAIVQRQRRSPFLQLYFF